MASVQEKIAESLKVLKDFQDSHDNMIIKGQSTLGETHTKRLLQNGYLQQVIRGWYIPSFPGSEGDTTVWYASYWQFVSAYATSRFGNDWCLTPGESLSFYAGETTCPSQLIIRSTKANNNVVELLHGDSLVDITASVPANMFVEPRFNIHLYPLAEALVFCSQQYFISDALNARTCLAQLKDASEIIKIVADEGNTTRASRICGALRNIGREDMADEISRFMQRLGHQLRIEDPFIEKSPLMSIGESPYSVRIRLMWEKMKKQIMSLGITLRIKNNDIDSVIKNMEANYAKDSYHSLSIEGYRVTEGLIEKVKSGNWNPSGNSKDSEQRNALAARGYYQAFEAVKDSVRKIMTGGLPGKTVAEDFSSWHFELFQPCITAGIIKASDLAGYRNHQVYIRNSKHTPLNPDALRDAMPTFCELIGTEENAFVRAILGHFFFVYIHPYMDGNGRTARFIMNSMLVTSGLPWTVIPVERRSIYMAALEKASIEGDISDFAQFIFGLIKK
ncbi:MAG: Fic family protein [Prevotella sp.]|jgi:Fic family protein|uniref:Fic family protein n=1 Tax=Prevotella sp. TaxID=59823 RepID=UPI00258A0E84|nr:Fic family protein [Prevotella sp.]MDD6854319.1 Fic family protein [Prevotella sp.]